MSGGVGGGSREVSPYPDFNVIVCRLDEAPANFCTDEIECRNRDYDEPHG